MIRAIRLLGRRKAIKDVGIGIQEAAGVFVHDQPRANATLTNAKAVAELRHIIAEIDDLLVVLDNGLFIAKWTDADGKKFGRAIVLTRTQRQLLESRPDLRDNPAEAMSILDIRADVLVSPEEESPQALASDD